MEVALYRPVSLHSIKILPILFTFSLHFKNKDQGLFCLKHINMHCISSNHTFQERGFFFIVSVFDAFKKSLEIESTIFFLFGWSKMKRGGSFQLILLYHNSMCDEMAPCPPTMEPWLAFSTDNCNLETILHQKSQWSWLTLSYEMPRQN